MSKTECPWETVDPQVNALVREIRALTPEKRVTALRHLLPKILMEVLADEDGELTADICIKGRGIASMCVDALDAHMEELDCWYYTNVGRYKKHGDS